MTPQASGWEDTWHNCYLALVVVVVVVVVISIDFIGTSPIQCSATPQASSREDTWSNCYLVVVICIESLFL